MITAAAICPPAPLLARELTGLDPVVPELRQACAAAVERLVRAGPEVVAVVGPGRRTAAWPADCRLDLSPFAPALGARDGREGPPLPLPLGLGARLLDEAGYRGTRRLESVSQDEPAAACLRLGAGLRSLGGRVGLLVMADGSACRGLRAPGYLDPRAAAFDAVLERAARTGDLNSLQTLDHVLARELLATARPGWQVLAGAMPRAAATEIRYADDPFGVFYLVAWLAGETSPGLPAVRGRVGRRDLVLFLSSTLDMPGTLRFVPCDHDHNLGGRLPPQGPPPPDLRTRLVRTRGQPGRTAAREPWGAVGLFAGGPRARATTAERRCRGRGRPPMLPFERCDEMGVSYYDALLPVREPGPGLRDMVAGIRLPYRTLASICVPAGRIVLAFVSDSARLSRMFAANWARTGTDQEPDATLYALARPACGYGLDRRWDEARWWSRDQKMMAVFRFGSYRLAKVCVRGICSAVSSDDIVFVHGCALSVGSGTDRRGVVITGSSGAGKTTLVAGLLRHPGYSVAVLNDDWGAISLSRGDSVSTGESMLHMKTGSVLALRPGFFGSAPAGSYLRDLSEGNRVARMLVSPESVYGTAWSTSATVVEHVAVVVREPAGWLPPGREGEAVRALESEGEAGLIHHHEAFFNGSLILATEDDKLREERHYRQLLGRATVSWINNCSTPQALVGNFISEIMKKR